MMAICILRLDVICRLMVIKKAFTINARGQGYLQVVLLMVRGKRERVKMSANKNINKMFEHPLICLTPGD